VVFLFQDHRLPSDYGSLAGQNVGSGKGLAQRRERLSKALPHPTPMRNRQQSGRWDTVTQRAQDLHLATFRSMGVAVLPPVVEGHEPIVPQQVAPIVNIFCWLGMWAARMWEGGIMPGSWEGSEKDTAVPVAWRPVVKKVVVGGWSQGVHALGFVNAVIDKEGPCRQRVFAGWCFGIGSPPCTSSRAPI
jgi:hypothetical protein